MFALPPKVLQSIEFCLLFTNCMETIEVLSFTEEPIEFFDRCIDVKEQKREWGDFE